MSPTLKELRKQLANLKKKTREEEEKIKLQRQIKDFQQSPSRKSATLRRKKVGKHLARIGGKVKRRLDFAFSNIEI